MKIAIVSGDDVIGDDAAQLGAALAARGHDVTRTISNGSHRILSTRVGSHSPGSDRELLLFVGDWAAELRALWSSNPPDVVHAHGWLGGLAAQLAARRQDLPTVQTFWGMAAMQRPESAGHSRKDAERQRIEPLLARNAGWVTGESTAEVDALAKLRRSRARLSVLTSGVDVERYTPVGPVLARDFLHRVLCLAPNPLLANGFDIVIKALARIPDTELVVAETEPTDRGRDRARAELKRLAKQLGVADRVSFAGAVADDGLPMLLRSADALACTPRQPPRATSVLQAMASGLAVVTLAVGVLSDVVVDAVTGLVLSTANEREVATALRDLVGHRFTCGSMGASGRNRAQSRFTWDRTAIESLTIYERLIAQHPALQGVRA